MKSLILLGLVGLFAATNAQVVCLNPGSVIIPTSDCCGQIQGQGLGGAMAEFFTLLDLECKLNIFFNAIITDPEVTEFFNYITGPEFTALLMSVQNMREFQDFMEYLCFNLDFDFYLYLNTLGDILG
jgi:Insect allergen related repeat, nitrile-specifier detoxification